MLCSRQEVVTAEWIGDGRWHCTPAASCRLTTERDDYKIDAATGAILGFDFDVEWYMASSKASDYIGEAKAKQIVEQAAGTTGVYTGFKLEVDDGRVLYEGEMRNGRMEYEFEIDALSGAILDWDADWD